MVPGHDAASVDDPLTRAALHLASRVSMPHGPIDAKRCGSRPPYRDTRKEGRGHVAPLDRHAVMEARSAAGVHRALPAGPGRRRAGRAGLAARTEVGRLSHHRPQGRIGRQAVVARRARLARHLSGHRRGDCGPAADEPDPRRRGRRAAGGRHGRLLRAAVAESPHRGAPDRLRSPRGRRRRTRALAAGGAPRAPGEPSSASISRRGCCSPRPSRATRARVLFRHACERNLEGIVSKRKGSPYISGPTTSWRKVRCPDYIRAGEGEGT